MSRLVVCSFLLAALALSLAGCGGGSGTEDALAGRWWGPALGGGSRGIEFEGGGRVIQFFEDGNPTGETGWIKHVDGPRYELYIDQGGTGQFILSPSGDHAAYLNTDDDFVVLQRGATTWSPVAFVDADLLPGDYEGPSFFVSNKGAYLLESQAGATFLADGTYTGSDLEGRTFFSPPATAVSLVDPVQGAFFGAYGDQYRPTGGEITILVTPDKLFFAAAVGWTPFGWEDGWLAAWTRR